MRNDFEAILAKFFCQKPRNAIEQRVATCEQDELPVRVAHQSALQFIEVTTDDYALRVRRRRDVEALDQSSITDDDFCGLDDRSSLASDSVQAIVANTYNVNASAQDEIQVSEVMIRKR